MVTYVSNPTFRTTVASAETINPDNGTITLTESNLWTANFIFDNQDDFYPDDCDVGDSFLIEVSDAGGAYTKLFSGSVFLCDKTKSPEHKVAVQCVGQGYGLSMMNVAEEYGVQSRRASLDTLQEVLTDSSYGVIPAFVHKALNVNSSGYSINTDNVEAITGTIPYILAPYKPADKFINDLCDLVTALQTTGNPGPHWICDHDAKLRVKLIGGTQVGWTKYYGNSQANATLTDGEDFLDWDEQPVDKEANFVIHYGNWRRPSSGDAWTENSSSLWAKEEGVDLSDNGTHIVGEYSLKFAQTSTGEIIDYPSDKNAAWNFSFSEFQAPTLNMYLRAETIGTPNSVVIYLIDGDGDYMTYTCGSEINNTWYHLQLPIGTYYKQVKASNSWTLETDAMDWTNVAYIEIKNTNCDLYIDGLHFGGVAVCRIARDKWPSEGGTLGQSTNLVKFKVIRDEQGKDDSLSTSDDGLMAQLAKAELLQLRKVTINAKFSTPLIADILPGQYVYINSKDWRITKITHQLQPAPMGLRTAFEVTDDLTNSHNRLRYDDINRTYAAIRPEWQDRQASTIKTGDLDIRITPLEKAY